MQTAVNMERKQTNDNTGTRLDTYWENLLVIYCNLKAFSQEHTGQIKWKIIWETWIIWSEFEEVATDVMAWVGSDLRSLGGYQAEEKCNVAVKCI